eukprot:TRINITY_DN67746_c7_g1_i1.p1 TRINITY_DN67746_c7_g1~~TRINITY_DN67746_c7_g1_i1.p1  ORF type:complete len:259 (-),score=6.34 TRINITY_DN67746_c7_g1_i1:174-950(-)
MDPLQQRPTMVPGLDWRSGQTFSDEKDDPDRVRVKAEPPAFALTAPPTDRAITREILDLPGERDRDSFACLLHNILTPEECLQMIDLANRKQWTPALVPMGSGFQQYMPETRDHARCIVDCTTTTDWLYTLIKPHLPQTLDGREITGFNERLRYICYHTPGQKLEAHKDFQFQMPARHPTHGGHLSYLTIQIYLGEGFEGGSTTFLTWGDGGRLRTEVKPKLGMALVFTQKDLLHEGSAVTKGIKYTLRTDVLYGPKK